MKTSSNVNTVLDALFLLNTQELKTVHTAVAQLLEVAVPFNKKNNNNVNIDLFYSVTTGHLQRRFGVQVQPSYRAQASTMWPLVKTAYASVEQVMSTLAATTSPADLNTARIRIWWWYSELVIDYLLEIKVPVSTKSFFNMSSKFAGLLDRAFPGYVESGLLSTILTANMSRAADDFFE